MQKNSKNRWSNKEVLVARLVLFGLSIFSIGLWGARANSSPEQVIWRECSEGERPDGLLKINEECYARHMARLTSEIGVNAALELLETVGDRIPSGECHLGSHFVGREALRIFGSPARAFQEYRTENYCSVGYSHGVVEEYIKDKPALTMTAVGTEICEAGQGGLTEDAAGKWQCAHGLGHVIMAFSDYDLPSSLVACDQFTDGTRQYGCGYGVFMENILAGHFRQGVISPWAKKDDPLFPCLTETVPERYQGPCFEWVPTQIVRYKTRDATEALRICLGQETERRRHSCVMGMGREMATVLNGTGQQLAEWCLAIPDQYQSTCLTQSMQYAVTTPARASKGVSLCNNLSINFRGPCSKWFGRRLRLVLTDTRQRRRLCDRLSEGKENCYREANLQEGAT